MAVLFIATRVLQVWLAERPINYGAGYEDMRKYERWSSQMVDQRATPYSDVAIEYPPGVIPFLAMAEVGRQDETPYRHRFIAMMVAVDLAGFAGLALLCRRWGSDLGLWVWITGPLLLGPIGYLRLDLIPAVMTIWALERASVQKWASSGAWLGLGALTKVYPLFLILPAAFMSTRPKRLVIGAIVAGMLVLSPFAFSLAGVFESVGAYHLRRGIQVESTWGAALLLASKLGYQGMHPDFQFGANEAVSVISQYLKIAGSLLSAATLIAGAAFLRRLPRDEGPQLAAGMFGILALLMFFGTVYSPQFTLWLIALSAAALCYPFSSKLRVQLLGVLVVAALTQAVFPFTIGVVLEPFYSGEREAGPAWAILLLGVRNLSVGLLGAWVICRLHLGASSKNASQTV